MHGVKCVVVSTPGLANPLKIAQTLNCCNEKGYLTGNSYMLEKIHRMY